MSYFRTPEHRRRQSEAIQRWKPWERSTGPRTPEGKARSAMRGYKGGLRPAMRELSAALCEQARGLVYAKESELSASLEVGL